VQGRKKCLHRRGEGEEGQGERAEKEESENVEGKPNSQMRAATTEDYGFRKMKLKTRGWRVHRTKEK
jgi:hypothetical protein